MELNSLSIVGAAAVFCLFVYLTSEEQPDSPIEEADDETLVNGGGSCWPKRIFGGINKFLQRLTAAFLVFLFSVVSREIINTLDPDCPKESGRKKR